MDAQTNTINYYQEATKDYEFWSKDFNMHFGLFYWNIFNREKMLQKMNTFILNKVGINNKKKPHFLDLGCGCGATLRQGCLANKKALFTGITLSPWQAKKGEELAKKQGVLNAQIINGDYHHLPFKNENFDGAYALESLCHSSNRLACLKEIYNKLKKGSKLVVADGFIKINPKETGIIFKKSYQMLCNGWSLPSLSNIYEFTNQLGEAGFTVLETKDISWKIAISVLHAPFVIVKYLLYALIGKAPLQKQNINNLKGSFISLFLGLQRSKFSYYIITAVKK